MPVLSLACHLPHNTPNIPSRYNNEQTKKQTKAINNSYIYIYISCKCDTNRAGHFTFDAYASRPVACYSRLMPPSNKPLPEPMLIRPMSPWTAYTRSVFINIVYDMDTLSALLVVCPSVSNGFQARIVSNTNLWWLRVLLLSWIRFWTNVEGLVKWGTLTLI